MSKLPGPKCGGDRRDMAWLRYWDELCLEILGDSLRNKAAWAIGTSVWLLVILLFPLDFLLNRVSQRKTLCVYSISSWE